MFCKIFNDKVLFLSLSFSRIENVFLDMLESYPLFFGGKLLWVELQKIFEVGLRIIFHQRRGDRL